MSKWIDVNEKLPESGKEVWIRLNNLTTYHGQYCNGYYDDEWFFMNDCNVDDDYYDVHVTHWREIEEI